MKNCLMLAIITIVLIVMGCSKSKDPLAENPGPGPGLDTTRHDTVWFNNIIDTTGSGKIVPTKNMIDYNRYNGGSNYEWRFSKNLSSVNDRNFVTGDTARSLLGKTLNLDWYYEGYYPGWNGNCYIDRHPESQQITVQKVNVINWKLSYHLY